MRIEYITRVLAIILGALMLAMAVAQYVNMPGFTESIMQYTIFAQNTRIIIVAFMVLELIAGVGLVAGSGSVKVFSSSANIALAVILAWFIAGALALSNNLAVTNWGLFGVFLVLPVSFLTEAILLVLGIAALFLALQMIYLKNRRGYF